MYLASSPISFLLIKNIGFTLALVNNIELAAMLDDAKYILIICPDDGLVNKVIPNVLKGFLTFLYPFWILFLRSEERATLN